MDYATTMPIVDVSKRKTRQTNWWHHPPAIYRNKQGLEGVGDILEQVGCSTYALLDADFHH